jgi:hypothetical protein
MDILDGYCYQPIMLRTNVNTAQVEELILEGWQVIVQDLSAETIFQRSLIPQ